MTLKELRIALESVADGAFKDKVAYRAFPVGAAPALPFICFQETESNNFFADAEVYYKITNVDIELYTENKDPATEEALESMLNSKLLLWEKSEVYIESEDVLEIVYEISI